jgi:tripartite-type tricarboxylate transporter receptor subunit TctC
MPVVAFKSRFAFQAVIAVVAALAVSSTQALAQAWPARPITMIAPYPAGGGVDAVARLIAEKLAERIGQPVVVDNRPGAAGVVGATAFARAPNDGYTIMMGSIVDYSIAPHTRKDLPFDMTKDFIPVVEIGLGTVVLVTHAQLPATNLAEFIALAKSKPGSLSYASSGTGGLQHLNAEMFKQMAGVDMVHIPYRGTAQLLPDLLTGRVQLAIDSLPAHLEHIRAGTTRALAVGSATRSTALPNVPTFAEAGLTGYETATNYTVFAPAGTPADIVKRLNTELNDILKLKDVTDRFNTLGIVVAGGTTEFATQRMGVEMKKWADVIRKGNLALQQ